MDEVKWLCTNGYPRNIRTETVIKYREKLKNDILKYLKNNNMRVNKRILDIILSNGFFERVSNRMGNKYKAYGMPQSLRDLRPSACRGSVKHAIGDVMNKYDYYSKLIEGFGNVEGFDNVKHNKNYLLYIVIIIIIIIIIYRIFNLYSKN